MSSIKAESWDPEILDNGYIWKNGKKVYIRTTEPKSRKFKKTLEGLSKELKRRMRRLSSLQRKCIKLYYFSQEPVTQGEIAKGLKISRTAVKEYLKRAIRKLKEE